MYNQLKNLDKMTKKDFSLKRGTYDKVVNVIDDGSSLNTLASLGCFETTMYNDIMYSSGLSILDTDVDGVYQGYTEDDSDELRSLHSHYFN